MKSSTRQEYTLRFAVIAAITVMAALHYGTKPAPQSPVAAAATAPSPAAQLTAKLTAPEPPPYMAHAGGLYEGKIYTNSIAALDHSYRQGHRLLEVDLNRTTDYQTVLLHDWDNTVTNVFGLYPGQRSLGQFRAETAASPVQFADLAALTTWVATHPDVHVVLDTKVNHFDILREIAMNTPELRARFVPYIYNFEDYAAVQRLGYANISLLIRPGQYTPAAVLEFARTHYLHSIAMQPEVLVQQSPELKQHVHIYCWTINDPAAAAALRSYGLYGVITDVLVPELPADTQPARANLSWIGD